MMEGTTNLVINKRVDLTLKLRLAPDPGRKTHVFNAMVRGTNKEDKIKEGKLH